MSGATPPDGDDPATEDGKADSQRVADSRVQGNLFQISGTGGNVTVGDTRSGPRRSRGRWATAVLAVMALGVGAAVWIGPGLPGSTERPARTSPSPSPLSVAATVNPVQRVRAGNFGGSFIFRQPAAQLPPLPSGYLEDSEVTEKWGYQHGGIDANQTYVELVVQGSAARSVVLTRLLIKVKRAVPPRATYVKVYPGADGVDGRWAAVYLDKQAPVLEKMHNFSYSGEHPNKPWSFPLRVSQEAVEVIHLNAITFRYDVQWTAELHFVANGRPGVVPITNNGRPFHTVSSAKSEPYKVENGRVVPGAAALGPAN